MFSNVFFKINGSFCKEIKYLKNGKPTIENGFISISHSGTWLGIIYSKDNEVGIDLEKINSRKSKHQQ